MDTSTSTSTYQVQEFGITDKGNTFSVRETGPNQWEVYYIINGFKVPYQFDQYILDLINA